MSKVCNFVISLFNRVENFFSFDIFFLFPLKSFVISKVINEFFFSFDSIVFDVRACARVRIGKNYFSKRIIIIIIITGLCFMRSRLRISHIGQCISMSQTRYKNR